MASCVPTAHVGTEPIVCVTLKALSIPSAIPSAAPTVSSGAKRTTPHVPKIIFGISAVAPRTIVGAFPDPSGNKYVRWSPMGWPAIGSVINANMAGQ